LLLPVRPAFAEPTAPPASGQPAVIPSPLAPTPPQVRVAPRAAPSAAAPPRAPASASASAGAAHGASETKGVPVRIHDRKFFDVLVGRGGRSAEQRAAEATKVIERLIEESEEPEIRVQEEGDVAVVYGGKSPIVQLGAEDAAAAGDATTSVHAQ